MYHYKESGLDNVFSNDGFDVHKPPYGEGVSITASAALHKAIGKWLISLPKRLNGAELRFLRVEMDTTQRHLAEIAGATEQTLRLWEKHRKKTIPGSADRLVRTLYSELIGDWRDPIRQRLKKLAALDQLKYADAYFFPAGRE